MSWKMTFAKGASLGDLQASSTPASKDTGVPSISMRAQDDEKALKRSFAAVALNTPRRQRGDEAIDDREGFETEWVAQASGSSPCHETVSRGRVPARAAELQAPWSVVATQRASISVHSGKSDSREQSTVHNTSTAACELLATVGDPTGFRWIHCHSTRASDGGAHPESSAACRRR